MREESACVAKETYTIIDSDPSRREAAIKAFDKDSDRMQTLAIIYAGSSDLLGMAHAIGGADAIYMLKGFTQTLFLLGYFAGLEDGK